MRHVDKPRIDRRGKVRFLDQAEESQLRNALMERDAEMRNLRTVANDRRQKRHVQLLPPLMHFGDHLTPAVLLSMNTGLRRGEVLKLRWAAVDVGSSLSKAELPRIARRVMCRSMTRQWACSSAGASNQVVVRASLGFELDSRRPGRTSSSAQRSPSFVGTICAITLLRALFSEASR
jgi:hypothetical protein